MQYVVVAAALALAVYAGYLALKRLIEAGRAKAREIQEYREQQEEYQADVRQSCELARSAYANIPDALLSAEGALDRAENDFRDSAFSPFWESIEKVVHHLGFVDQHLTTIDRAAARYREIAPLVDEGAPRFPVQVSAANQLVAANSTGSRLRAIVRDAQRNFQFATIFEQRKTTQVIIIGFSNLGEALEGVGDRIASSVDTLRSQVGSMEATIARVGDEQRQQTERLAAKQSEQAGRIADAQSEQWAKIAQIQSDDGRRQRAMLDNIQRGKAPGFFENDR